MVVIEAPESGNGQALFAGVRRQALLRFLKTAQRAVQLPGEVNLLLADDARLKALNKAFRGKNKATDVLSFPAAENGEGVAGDLAISVETAARQAEAHGHAMEVELRVLTLHGLLHLAGYDHEADEGEMRALESQLRARLKLPGGLIERAGPDVVTVRQPKVVAGVRAAAERSAPAQRGGRARA